MIDGAVDAPGDAPNKAANDLSEAQITSVPNFCNYYFRFDMRCALFSINDER